MAYGNPRLKPVDSARDQLAREGVECQLQGIDFRKGEIDDRLSLFFGKTPRPHAWLLPRLRPNRRWDAEGFRRRLWRFKEASKHARAYDGMPAASHVRVPPEFSRKPDI